MRLALDDLSRMVSGELENLGRVAMTVRHVLRRMLGSVPGVRWWYGEMRSTRRTSEEALRLATESARAVETLLQSELELKRELAALRAVVMGDGTPREADRERVR